MVYLLPAAGLFAEVGYGQVWAKLTAGLAGSAVATPTAGALAQARRRLGPAPLRALFDLLRGPAAGLGTKGVYRRGRLVTAVDGTMMCCPDTPANLGVYRKGGGHHGGTGYPMIRMPALVARHPHDHRRHVRLHRYRGDHLHPGPAPGDAPGDDRVGGP